MRKVTQGGRACSLALPLASFVAAAFFAGPLEAAETEPSAIVALAFDTSGSLTPAELAQARDLALQVLRSLPRGSEVAVFTFDDQSRLIAPRTTRPEQVTLALASVRIAGRFTALHDALYDASRYLRDAPRARKAIVLATDGKDENSALNLDDGLKVAQETGIPVYAIGMGHVQERVLRRIAKLTSGEYFPEGEATGSVIAAKIAALSPPSSTLAVATPAAPLAATSAPMAGAAAKPDTTKAPAVARTVGRLWMILAVGLLVALAATAWVALRRRPVALCPSCGRELPGPDAECDFCAPDSAPLEHEGRAGDTAPPGRLSSTVVSRLNSTEEYLEKTLVLQETPVLVITKGPGSGQSFKLSIQSTTSLGRAKANDIVLQDVSISSQHCRIRPQDGLFVVHDLKSTNGTFVNERRVTHHTLSEGDVIKIGETWLQFRREQTKNV